MMYRSPISNVLRASSSETSTSCSFSPGRIPIVSISGDPVGLGLAASLAHPQGNLTGFAILSVDVEAKQLQILKDTISGLAAVAVLTNSTNAVNPVIVKSIRRTGSSMGIGIQELEVQDAAQLAKAFDAAVRRTIRRGPRAAR